MIYFVNITEDEFLRGSLLYKHLPLENALKTLNEKALWFSNPSTWRDPYERRFIEAEYYHAGKKTSFRWVGKIYCSCFSQTVSSEAFWKSYSSGSVCIEFRIDRRRLLEMLNSIVDYDVYIGRVEYMKTTEIDHRNISDIPFNPPLSGGITSPTTAARLFMLKRISFKYEDEIRVLLVANNKSSKAGVAVPYTCSNVELIKNIFLDPAIGDNTEKMLLEVFENKYGFIPKSNGNKRVAKSVLYRDTSPVVVYLD